MHAFTGLKQKDRIAAQKEEITELQQQVGGVGCRVGFQQACRCMRVVDRWCVELTPSSTAWH
jgi:hypothetical protein